MELRKSCSVSNLFAADAVRLGQGKPTTMAKFGPHAAFIEENPIARFIFKYRSRGSALNPPLLLQEADHCDKEGLKQLLIIPCRSGMSS